MLDTFGQPHGAFTRHEKRTASVQIECFSSGSIGGVDGSSTPCPLEGDGMTLDSWLHFGHVLSAIVWVGGGLMLSIVGLRVRASGEPNAIGSSRER